MKSLTQYITECEETDIILYKVGVFFDGRPDEYRHFVDTIRPCWTGSGVDVTRMEVPADAVIRPIVDFISDNTDGVKDIPDYGYLFKTIVRMILSDRSEHNQISKSIIGY